MPWGPELFRTPRQLRICLALRRPGTCHAALLLPGFPRYNRSVLAHCWQSRLVLAPLLTASAFLAAACVAPLGPGYTIETQQVRVQFVPGLEPRIRIEADFQLRNTGNQPLSELELRLPGRRRFHYEQPLARWDSAAVTFEASTDNPRNTLITFVEPWAMSARHTLHLSAEYLPTMTGETTLSFSNDAFFLPAQGWSPELLPAKGLFATGGVPPKKWRLDVRTPQGFLIHTSGRQTKSSRSGGELAVTATQGANDRYAFVIAGRYTAAQMGDGKQRVYLWTQKPQEAAGLRELSEALARTITAYDSVFGTRATGPSATWIVECPMVAGCFTNLNPSTAKLLGEEEKVPVSAEMVSEDTMMVDLSGGAPKLAAAAAPSLAASWLGYAQNPGFYEQAPPLSAFPAFAASIGREAAEGADSRVETIRRGLRLIPEKAGPHQAEDQAVLRAKSFLFFYALEDRYGSGVFRKAIQHMLYARRERGLELSDLIAAFDQETHENNAAFVRRWMKRPGVPEDFRKRYEDAVAPQPVN